MINEERVTEMYHMAVYDRDTNRQTEQMRAYYGRDYVGKEVLKSIFSGTIAYGLILVMAGMGMMQDMEAVFDSMDLTGTIVGLVLLYLAFEALYIVITVAVYRKRFREGRAELKLYAKHLKKVNKMYAREDKIKG